MKVRLIIVQYKNSYPGQHAPNVADAWDEYSLEGNFEGFAEALAKHEAMVGGDYEDVKVLDVNVPDAAIDALFTVPSADADVGPLNPKQRKEG